MDDRRPERDDGEIETVPDAAPENPESEPDLDEKTDTEPEH